jgi:hypothetical protein
MFMTIRVTKLPNTMALHFIEEELDFIINYDIKYRMGGELEGNE